MMILQLVIPSDSYSLPVAVTNFGIMWILKLVEKALEATILIFNLVPSVML